MRGRAALLANEVEQAGGVAGVEHPEARVEAERGGVEANEPVRDGVKGAAQDAARPGHRARGQRAGALDHLARRAPREGEQQDPLRGNALREQPSDARAERRRLPGARTREYQQRSARMGRSRLLLGVELVEPALGITLRVHKPGDARGTLGWRARVRAATIRPEWTVLLRDW